MNQTFEITLEQPVIISQQAATVGAHQSLDYIAGSTLLGLVASRLYTGLSEQEAWEVFHSGRFRFGDALPVHQNEVAYPVPMCWHAFKGHNYIQAAQQLNKDQIFDVSQLNTTQNELRQPIQLREFYTTPSGRKITPKREQTLKTAIDAKTGMAAESQLFGYEALSAGQTFRFTLSAAAETPATLWQQVSQALIGDANLGRSRSAQFGRVRIEKVETVTIPTSTTVGQTLTLWLLSDLWLMDKGQPSLVPKPSLLGLPEGATWAAEMSFVRTRRYSVYNAYRRHYDRERQVITRGSVLRYTLPAGVALTAEHLQKLAAGIGAGTESGLGQVCINPALLSTLHPQFAIAQQPEKAAAQTITQPTTRLIEALLRRKNGIEGRTEPASKAAILFNELCARIREARRFAATPQGTPIENAPQRTQFGRFKEFANIHRNAPAQLWVDLTEGDNGMLRDRSGWNLSFGTAADAKLGTWLKAQLEPHHDQVWFPTLIGELAVLGMSDQWKQVCEGSERNKEKAA